MRHMLMSPKITLKILNRVKEDVISTDYRMPYGICTSFNKDHEYSIQDCLCQAGIDWADWPKFSGNSCYPVPSDVKTISACSMFNMCRVNDYWNPNDNYGKHRMELLDWMIEQLESIVEKQHG